ncbi:MAG: pyrroline-5-carboxylate reductase [Coriobacteriia bacterium]|nr:pyrroline-5-carboxylate reductase [Coriobacteriia bacterium]
MSESDIEFPGRIVVVGAGKMGQAIITGILASGRVKPAEVLAVAPTKSHREALTELFGIETVSTAAELSAYDIGADDFVIMAVKPQIFFDVLSEVKAATKSPLLISIAVGISTDSIERVLGRRWPVVRVMPNTPSIVGRGMALVSAGKSASAAQEKLACELFTLFGKAVIIKENLQDAGAALSGSGPAYFALVIDALTRAGITQGLTRDLAQELSVQTMAGTAAMIEQNDIHPEVLIDMVTSPGGTTIQALNELEAAGLRSAFVDAVDAAVYRAYELNETDEDADDENGSGE